jgi:RHS repeat-associated protein
MTTRRIRSLAHTLAVALLAVLVFSACPPSNPVPLPLAGWAEFQDLLFVRVPGGSVNTGGGNFYTRRSDLSIDTRVGSYSVAAAYNSASGGWHWAHEMTYVGSSFVDETGASFDLTSVANGSAIPGTHWVRVDADSIKTKGGLVRDFSASGKLAAIHWLGFDYPRLRFTTQIVGGGTERVTAIDQCTALATCASVFTLAYTASAQLETVTDRAARVASFTWDASGRLATAKDGLDNAKGWLGFRYEYSGTNLTAITSSENERIEYTYDGSARLLTAKKIGDGDPTSTFAYFGAQSSGYYQSRFTNPLAQIAKFNFDASRRLFSVQLVTAGETTSFQWSASGLRVTQIIRPDGIQASFAITDDDVTQVTQASGNIITISYAPNAIDPASPSARPADVVSDSVGLVLDRGYDGQGRLTSVSSGSGDTTVYAWNGGSPTELASVTSPAGGLTTYNGYGEHGHPGGAVSGNPTYPLVATFSYDAVGNTLNGQDADSELSPGMGGVVSRTFDADRNIATVLLQSVHPAPGGPYEHTMTLEYRSDGMRKAIRPPSGGDTEFDYSATGRVLGRREKADGAWVTTAFGYDGLDRITSTELANGMRSELGHDAAGRVNAITSKRSGAVEETLTRSFAAGRLTSSVDSAFTGSETYAYDSAGRVTTLTYPGGERRELIYDLRSRVTIERFVAAGGVTVVELLYSYDLANRVTEVRRNPGNLPLLAYTYTGGFVTQTDYGSGLRRTATIDTGYGTPDITVTTTASAQTLESTNNGHAAAYVDSYSTIDGLADGQFYMMFGGRIWSDAVNGGFFIWDSLSNLREKAQQELFYNPEANRLTQVRDNFLPNTVRHSYAYDAAGFATARDGVALGYDATGAIASIGSVAAFDHDLSGRPVSRTLNGVTKLFRFGGAIAYTPSGSPLELDLGEVVIKLDGSTDRYRHVDFRGNVRFVTNGNTVEGQAGYGSFGRDYEQGELGERGFAGGFEIESLGLVVLGPRVLDSDTGRFLSQDPVFNAVNQYAYAQGNPVFMWDPTGTVSTTTATVAGVVFATGIATGVMIAVVVSAPATTTLGAFLLVAEALDAGFLAGYVGLGALNLAFEAADPGTARWNGFRLSLFGLDIGPFPSGGVVGGGTGGGSGGGSIHGPGQRVNKKVDIFPTPDGAASGGDASFSFGGLTFSIALSFAGAMW